MKAYAKDLDEFLFLMTNSKSGDRVFFRDEFMETIGLRDSIIKRASKEVREK